MPNQQPVRILIVDDEESLMMALANTLREQGYETTGFTHPDAALAALRKQRFDLLLSDLTMPEIDGITMLRRGREADPEMVGIIMTGDGTIGSAVEAMKSGAFDYILKPFRLGVILQVLSRALAVRQLSLEKAALERRVLERTSQLEIANKELEAFSYSVSHDLRAPLRHIDGYAHLLAISKESSLSAKDRETLEHIASSSKRMARLIEDLLNFSRMGRSEIRHTRLDLSVLLEEVLREIRPEIEGRNIVWKKGALPSVEADPNLLRQVLSNLLLNAVKYTGPRNPAEIEIGSLPESDGQVGVFVRDNGVGFDMKYAHRLFGVFQRLHRDADFEGTGIGLANVQRVIARHSGRTWADGKVDSGATFYFTLPKVVAKPTG